jgi:hypothetical protein
MSIYRIGRTGTVTTSGSAAFDVATPTAAGVRARVMEFSAFLGAATASTYGINRPSAIGTRTSPVALLAEDVGDPALTGIMLVDSAVAHSVQPTMAAADMAMVSLPATIGTGMVWTFPRGLILGTQGSIVLVNRATNSASVQGNAVVDV